MKLLMLMLDNSVQLAMDFSVNDAMATFRSMRSNEDVAEEQLHSGKMKIPPILTPDILYEHNSNVLRNDPNNGGFRKLHQLELLQRLNLLYEAGNLRKCFAFLLCSCERG